MAREVRPDDFSDKQLKAFAEGVEKLVWASAEKLPPDLARHAADFAEKNPRPTPDELRQLIDHAVTIARGWDDPDNPRVMLHSALKLFHFLAWLEYLESQPGVTSMPKPAYHVTFTPTFKHAGPD